MRQVIVEDVVINVNILFGRATITTIIEDDGSIYMPTLVEYGLHKEYKAVKNDRGDLKNAIYYL